MENEMINELAEYIMAHGTIVVCALAHKDKQMLVKALEDFIPSSKDTMITFSFKEYIGNDEKPVREIFFDIPKECLEQYLGITKKSIVNLDVAKFVEACGNEDIANIYGDASGITNEHIIYCDEFEKAFTEYVRKMFLETNIFYSYSEIIKNSYYENIYYPEKLKEQGL